MAPDTAERDEAEDADDEALPEPDEEELSSSGVGGEDDADSEDDDSEADEAEDADSVEVMGGVSALGVGGRGGDTVLVTATGAAAG